jgi:hypothetical protein
MIVAEYLRAVLDYKEVWRKKCLLEIGLPIVLKRSDRFIRRHKLVSTSPSADGADVVHNDNVPRRSLPAPQAR